MDPFSKSVNHLAGGQTNIDHATSFTRNMKRFNNL
jgi:hypothetical protein